ncbi:hypothetical protein JKF63_06401 [Porcisia hertigi]|uniref:Uncharacterized protein n=1 Tax=Porcisia hertigi TaxID=2761500 RepID=A0A837AXZ1_9TRYP|nr:hypothetical protein JKF63_06401 [Porcisia hertigi]
MCDSYGVHAQSPLSLLSRDRERVGGDTTAQLNTTMPHPRQLPGHHQPASRESHATDVLDGDSLSNSTSQVGIRPCGVSTLTSGLLNVVDGGALLAVAKEDSHWSLLLSSASEALNHAPGTLISPPTKCGVGAAAVHPPCRAAPTSPDAIITLSASSCVTTSAGAVPSSHCEDHSSTRTSSRVKRLPSSEVLSPAAISHHNRASRPFFGPLRGLYVTSRQVTFPTAASAATSAELATPQRHCEVIPSSTTGDGAITSGRRSRSCPCLYPCSSVRRAAAADAAMVPSPAAANIGVRERLTRAAVAIRPARSPRGASSGLNTDGLLQRGAVSPPTHSFRPLELWSTSSTTVVAVATAESPTGSEIETFAASTPDVDIGSLHTYEIDSGVVIMDSCHTPEDLVCGVCMSLCRRPTTTPCGHVFCRSCLQAWIQANPAALCPLDRTPIQVELLHTDVRAQRQINALPCRCPASLSRTPQLELLRLRSARSVLGDGAAGEGSDGGDVTGDVRKPTAHPRCTWTGCVSDAVAHLRQCPYIIVECPFCEHGCTVELPRVDMMAHMRDCVEDHLLLFSQALVTSKELCRVLQEEVEVLRQRCSMVYSVAVPNVSGDGSVENSGLAMLTSSSPFHTTVVPSAALVIPGGARAPEASAATTTSHEGFPTGSGSLPGVVNPFGRRGESAAAAAASAPVISQAVPPPYHSLQRPSNAAPQSNVRLHAVTDDMLCAPQRMPGGYDPSTRMPVGTMPLCPSSHLGAPRTSVPVAKTTAAAPTFTSTAGAAGLIPSPVVSALWRSSPEGRWARGVDRFVWVITHVTSLQAPCYSRPFASHGLLWYVGIDATATWDQSGVYLFPMGHEHRVNFRVILYHEDPARDVLHDVQDWQEDYIGKGWGPLRFINRFKLEQEGFLVRDCLRVGIEVLSGPY